MSASDTQTRDVRRIVSELCEQASGGQLTLRQLHNQWPPGASDTPFFQCIFEDLEDAVEHYPAGFVNGRPHLSAWEASEAFHRLLIAARLLESDANTEILMAIRAKVLSDLPRRIDQLGDAISRELRARLAR